MRSWVVWLSLALSLLHFGSGRNTWAQDTASPLRVEEEKMRFHLLPHTQLELPVLNSTQTSISGKFALQLLNFEDDSVAAQMLGTFFETPGETFEKVEWPFENLPSDTPSTLGWYRLRYSFEPLPGSGVAPIAGIVQLGQIITDGFSIELAGAEKVAPGSKYPLRVHVENPVTHKPDANSSIELVLEFGDDEATGVRQKIRTDARGNATAFFNLPEKAADQEGKITATITRGKFSDQATLKIKFPDSTAPGLTITTDKPRYQPGQTVHLRLLALDSDGHAMLGAKLDLAIDYGWGFSGRLETTALAVTALAKLQSTPADHEVADMTSRGLQYLLTHKDRYAMWYSTQATQNVLEAMIAALPPVTESAGESEATIKINGRLLRSIHLPRPEDAVGPITVSLPNDLANGANKIEFVRQGNPSALNASLVTSYYIPWTESDATNKEAFKTGETRALRYKVLYDHTELKLGETVQCSVAAESIGFRGYGMMLAEVGLPPGAEVDRASLKKVEDAPGVFGYELQPDRVVFYVWPTAGGTSFAFDFRLRYRVQAMTAASTVYDYYNPEANATVAPVRFTIR